MDLGIRWATGHALVGMGRCRGQAGRHTINALGLPQGQCRGQGQGQDGGQGQGQDDGQGHVHPLSRDVHSSIQAV